MCIIEWDGITQVEMLDKDTAKIRHKLADAAKSYNWSKVLALIANSTDLVNITRPSGLSLYAPLHQAAHGGASVEVVQRLVGLGAWRTLQNSRGERPVDIAERRGYPHLLDVLAPQYKHHIPLGVLLKIQAHFHTVIRQRVKEMLHKDMNDLRLPELEPLLELDNPKMWFRVPGMYGGFGYRFEITGVEAKLVSESWSRMSEGSGQRHEITSAGSRLVEEGFI